MLCRVTRRNFYTAREKTKMAVARARAPKSSQMYNQIKAQSFPFTLNMKLRRNSLEVETKTLHEHCAEF